MELIVKRTHELTDNIISRYCEAYTSIFQHKKTPDFFKSEFMNTCLGYSFHSILIEDDGHVVGGYTAIPMPFIVNGMEMLFAFGVDLMIADGYRDDVNNLLTVIKANDKILKEEGITCFYGFPNDNSYKVNLAFIRMRDICSLSTYILPYHVGDAKPIITIFNPLSVLFSKCMLGLSKIFTEKKVISYPVSKNHVQLVKTRYKWFDGEGYENYKDGDVDCYWKITDFEGTRAAFLMDVHPMSKYNFDKAVREMVKACKDRTGLFIYVGMLPFTPFSMIKVPQRFAPKNFHFVAKIIDKKALDKEIIYTPNNWDVNLASYDLL